MRNACLFAIVLLLAACATKHAPLPTVGSVDVDRYQGTWYEIALIPNWFQRMCVADTQARYRRDGDIVRVNNRCRDEKGKVESIEGVAKSVEGSNNAKLRVSFFRPFYGNYWILALDQEYQWVLIGEPSRTYGWVLARSPQMSEDNLNVILERAQSLGYDKAAFRRTPQNQPLEP